MDFNQQEYDRFNLICKVLVGVWLFGVVTATIMYYCLI